ncbi:hypothetical protein BC332_07927 [Capsicum chinense]|nr:hypothetical protein BC332_07927 [Capsicum chinense]
MGEILMLIQKIIEATFPNQYGPTNEGTTKCLFLLDVTGGGSGKGMKNMVVIVVVVLYVLVVGLVVVGYWFLWQQLGKKWNTRRLKSNLNSRLDLISGSTTFIRYTSTEIKADTKNFYRLNIIRVKGYGNVYKGVLPGGNEATLKRFKNCSIVVCEANNGQDLDDIERSVSSSGSSGNLSAAAGYQLT